MLQQQFEEITAWQKETFPQATADSKIAHLQEEVDELAVDVHIQAPDRRLEYADCFLLLYGSAAADGMSYDDIIAAIQEKFEINKKRTWGKPNENGVVNHLKDV